MNYNGEIWWLNQFLKVNFTLKIRLQKDQGLN